MIPSPGSGEGTSISDQFGGQVHELAPPDRTSPFLFDQESSAESSSVLIERMNRDDAAVSDDSCSSAFVEECKGRSCKHTLGSAAKAGRDVQAPLLPRTVQEGQMLDGQVTMQQRTLWQIIYDEVRSLLLYCWIVQARATRFCQRLSVSKGQHGTVSSEYLNSRLTWLLYCSYLIGVKSS